MDYEAGTDPWNQTAPEEAAEQPSPTTSPAPSLGENGGTSSPLSCTESRTAGPARRSRGWVWLVPAVIFAAGCVYLGLQNRAAAATVEALTTKAPAMLLPMGAPNPLAAQLDSVRRAADSSNFLAAMKCAQALALPTGQQAPLSSAAGAPEAPTPLTPQITAFFAQHPDLEKRLTQYSDAARAARDAGKDVQALRDLRTQVLAAADKGDAVQVGALLDQFGQRLAALGGNAPPPPSPEMQKMTAQLQQAFNQAEHEGRDPRAGVALFRQAQTAAASGQSQQALALAHKALEALKHAPRAAGAGSGMARTGPPAGAAERMLGTTLNLMGAEDQDLGRAYAALEEASRALRENNQAQIQEILATARQDLDHIRQRRQAFSQELNRQAPAPKPGATPPPATPAPPAAEPAGPAEKIALLMDEARKLTPDQYREGRLSLARGTLEILLNMGPPAPEPPAPGQTLTPAQRQAAEEAGARVREKLRLAQEPFEELKRQGKDTSAIAGLLSDARQALYEGHIANAEDKVTEALRELRVLPAKS